MWVNMLFRQCYLLLLRQFSWFPSCYLLLLLSYTIFNKNEVQYNRTDLIEKGACFFETDFVECQWS